MGKKFGEGVLAGMFNALMKYKKKHGSAANPSRRERHKHAQMKYFSSNRFSRRSRFFRGI